MKRVRTQQQSAESSTRQPFFAKLPPATPAHEFFADSQPGSIQRQAETPENAKEKPEQEKILQEEAVVEPVQRACAECDAEENEAPAVQTKLSVGDPDDQYEQEADRVADQVVQHMQTAKSPTVQAEIASESPNITPLVRRHGEGTANVSPQIEKGIQHSRGSGEPIAQTLRQPIERAMNADFSGVRIHNNTQADALNRSLNARAFTAGQDIYFRSGEYRPEQATGQKLLAHELTHVVQQGAKNTIQRKILIDGNYYIPKQDYDWIRKAYGQVMVEFLESMHNKGQPPEFKFKDYKQMHYEVRVRSQAIKGMEKTASGCCSYPSIHIGGYINSTYWDKKGSYHFEIKSPLPAGKTPADAIEAIFAAGAGTELECNSMMTAVQYRSILHGIGEKRFNLRFPAGVGVVIKPVLAHLLSATSAVDLPNALKTEKLYTLKSISSITDLLPGDWVYFLNVPDYPTKHPSGFWTGEHALYMGNQKFSGFGLQGLSNDDILHKLLEQYNSGLPLSEQKAITDVPGILPQVIRRPLLESYIK